MPDIGTIESTLAIIISLGAMMGWMWRSITARIDRDLKDLNKSISDEKADRAREDADIRHDVKNLATKQDALAREHVASVQRIVAVETTMVHVKDTLDRMDANVLALLKRDQQ